MMSAELHHRLANVLITPLDVAGERVGGTGLKVRFAAGR